MITGENFKSQFEVMAEQAKANLSKFSDADIKEAILGGRKWGDNPQNRVPQGVTLIADFTGITLKPEDFYAKSAFTRTFEADKYVDGKIVMGADGKAEKVNRFYNVLPLVSTENGQSFELGINALFNRFLDPEKNIRKSEFKGAFDADIASALNGRQLTKEEHIAMFCKFLSGKRLSVVVESYPDSSQPRGLNGYPSTKIATVTFE